MSASMLLELMRQVDKLSHEEQLRLLDYIAERTRQHAEGPKWGDIAGMAPDLLAGEDAQAWVRRQRRGGTERREALFRQ